MQKEHKAKNRLLLWAFLLFLLVFVVSAVFLLLEIWERQQGRFAEIPQKESSIEYMGTDYVFKNDVETFLIMGLDKFEQTASEDSFNNEMQADFLMLLVFDKSAQKCTALQINRDTMTDVHVLGVAGQQTATVTEQIALAHTYGNGKQVSCRNTADAVSGLLRGVNVDHYISLTMDSVATLNDLAGGVEVTVLDDFSGVDNTLIKGETVTLQGEHTLNYVRTRYGLEDSTNNTRMARQRQYLNALFAKVNQCAKEDDNFIVNASLEMADYIVSDRSATQLQELAKNVTEYGEIEIKTLDGTSTVGEEFMEFYPDEDSVKKTVVELFCKPKSP
ncbi:MAG: LCP family protein [Oscillospiraceae bacterium]|jgi:LCP family protein required for cell wall assembly|nr:LCP family protein [Oscillospiraceae bacterium]